MPKRLTWMTVGFGLGVGATVAATRKAKQQAARYKPAAVVERTQDKVVDGMVRLRDQLAAAVDDGKTAAKAREAELRARAPEGRGGDPDPVGREAPGSPPTTL
jgi:hypothetical protein